MSTKSSALFAIVALASLAGCAGLEPDRTGRQADVQVGMTATEVRSLLGAPSTNFRYRAASGPTWTYPNAGSIPDNVLFEIDFDAAGRVAAARRRIGPSLG